MDDYLRPLIKRKPEHLILHVGTNDIGDGESLHSVAERIVDVATKTLQHSPSTGVAISTLLTRSDKCNLDDKILETNNILKSLCSTNGLVLIEHPLINATCLNRRGLHVNRKGSSVLTTDFKSHIASLPTSSRIPNQWFACRECHNITPKGGLRRLSFGRGIVIACLNINSLVAHIDELRIIIHDTKIDILAINETKLDHTISDCEVYLPNFEIVRRDRSTNGRHGSGVCL